jgi:hypothetical protein
MRSTPKLFISLFPGFIVGMFFQHHISKNQSESLTTSTKLPTSKERVDGEVNTLNARRTGEGVHSSEIRLGATFGRDQLIELVSNADNKIYVRLGIANSQQTVYIGNDKGEYLTPAYGYCPSECP